MGKLSIAAHSASIPRIDFGATVIFDETPFRSFQFGCFAVACAVALFAERIGHCAEKPDQSRASTKAALGPLQSFVGVWKGGGTTKRGATEGAWVEQAQWAWNFDEKSTTIEFRAPQSKIYTAGRIQPGEEEETFRLTATPAADRKPETFTGRFDDAGRLVFEADNPQPGRPVEIAMRLLARGRRLLVIYRRQSTSSEAKLFLAEVGYTRKGSNFGREEDLPECVLTGGEASIAVSYDGKTYYVCCSGCRDYFVEHPEKVLAEYRKRLAEREEGEK